MSSKVNNRKNLEDIVAKKRVSAPTIPFYNNISKKNKGEEINKKRNNALNDIIRENSEDEESIEESSEESVEESIEESIEESSEESEEKNKKIKNDIKKNVKNDKEIKKNVKNTVKKDVKKEIKNDIKKDIKKDVKKDINKEINKDVNKDINTGNIDYRTVTGKFRNYNSFSLSSAKLSRQLKEILTRKLCLKDFSDWFNSVIISMQNDDLNEFITYLDCIQESDDLATEFFKYIYNLSKSKKKGYKYTYEAEKLYNKNKLGPICFITPELGNWTNVKDVGKTVDELTKGLCCLGQDIIIITPYYYSNYEGKTNYLEGDPLNFQHTREVTIYLDNNYTFNVYSGNSENGIKYYFLENRDIFERIYNEFNTYNTIREISCMGKASLQLLFDLKITPSVIVTNDWYTGLTPAFSQDFGDTFSNTKFLHLIHNLEPMNEGKIYYSDNNYEYLYKFNKDWVIDPFSQERVINPSRCAIIKSDQWATVSKSYKRHLQLNSPYADLLNQKPCPFAYPIGIFINQRLKEINEVTGGNKQDCKKYIQQKYFGYEDADYSIPLYSFIGQIKEDKGIKLILDSLEEIFRKTNGKINILIAGTGDHDDPFFIECVNRFHIFKNNYQYSFSHVINNTKDIEKIYLGSDFGMIPSSFEPGGINQQIYLICGTPVLAFKTGSLKDTITEFNYQTSMGNGIMFDFYNNNEFIEAFLRSLNIFKNKEKYDICSQNAKNDALDISEVSKAWCKEFCKLNHKLFFDNSKVKDISMSKITDSLLIKDYKESNQDFNENNLNRIVSKKRKSNIFGMDSFQSKNLLKNKMEDFGFGNSNNYLKDDEVVKKFVYYYLDNYQPKVVEISGSFDEWKIRHRLIHYPREKKWEISMKLKKGKHLYKYIIDGDWQINPREPSEKGEDGFVNNYIIL